MLNPGTLEVNLNEDVVMYKKHRTGTGRALSKPCLSILSSHNVAHVT
jgi:hypothetical protein